MARNLDRQWFQTDRQFRAQQEIGSRAEDLVLQQLLDAGLPAKAGQRGFRERLQDRYRWCNQADIMVAQFRIEVKSSRFEFLGPGSWPEEWVEIDPVWKFDQKQPRPFAYVFYSRPMRGLVTAGCRTERLHVLRDRKDRFRKTTDDWYVTAPRYLRRFDELVNTIMGRLER